MRFEDIKAMIDILPPEELSKLRSYLNGKKPVVEASDDWLLDSILAVVKERGHGSIPIKHVRTMREYTDWYQPAAEKVRTFLEENTNPQSYIEQRAAGLIAARELARYVGQFLPVSLRTLLRYTPQIPEALDRSFPGYAPAGLLGAIIKRRARHDA